MSRYDDPRWYEDPQEANTHTNQNPPSPNFPASDDFSQSPSFFLPESDATPAYYYTPHTSSPATHKPAARLPRVLGRFVATLALIGVAFIAGWFGHQFFGTSFDQSNQSRSYSQLIQEAWNTIDQNYVDRQQVDYKKMAYSAIDAMVKSLNDTGHTRFLTPEQARAEQQQLSGKFTGIGIYLHQEKTTNRLIITAPIPGSPAEKAGVKPGDVLIAVNGVSVVGKDVQGASNLIQGKEGTSVTITVQRAGVAQPLTFKITRAVIQVPNVIMHYIAENHIVHIQVVQFADGVSNQLKDAITQAKSRGATAIILDLRDNPGGYLTEAINTTSLFLQKGNVLLEQDSKGRRTPVAVSGNPLDAKIPVVVLVNGNSASAAEIVSGALKDNKRATLIGEKTFGTGTVLQHFTLADHSAILLGTQEWLTPNGQFIRDRGIMPDIEVKMGPDNAVLSPTQENASNMTLQQILSSRDPQLIRAIQYLNGQK
ncbi:MAG: S41 family peptidase [Ktedonobacteraceae bacterium]|nr:S41 family peptidase [Ktedonobacteraceae bacterium]